MTIKITNNIATLQLLKQYSNRNVLKYYLLYKLNLIGFISYQLKKKIIQYASTFFQKTIIIVNDNLNYYLLP